MFSRRSFLSKSTLAAIATILGTRIVFGHNAPENWRPVGWDDLGIDPLKDKHPDMKLLNDKPLNVETPAHLLDDDITPAEKMFIRNNGLIPENIDINKWTLSIEGEAVKKAMSFTLTQLKKQFKPYTYQLVLECGGNGRTGFNPPTRGNQWSYGAVSCAQWTGARLKDILDAVGLKSTAQYIGFYGKDTHISGDLSKVVISRGVPISKALEEQTLVAWQMNGKDIPLVHGFPLRLVIGGWPASVSGKWLHKIAVRDKVHDGAKMKPPSYSVPIHSVAPGEKVDPDKMRIIEAMPVKSLITWPKSGGILRKRKTLDIRGHAWAGDRSISKMEVSIDFGATWQTCELEPAANYLAWQHWSAQVAFPGSGYYEVWAKATDSAGISQPISIPNWNPQGYLNNSCHRIAIKVA
ncbi:MAG: sulfite oxidase [Saprospiraceae bacterium]|nr:sulfite oxidase [Saprospiraceae bacterium]